MEAFLRKEFAINGIDGLIGALYCRVFWVFFSKRALLIYPGIVVSGLGLFFYTVQLGTYPILEAGGKWYWGLLTFMGVNLVVILVREAAHAFATKRYGRRVRRGGLLVYLGGPAFFVDTMDIWMEPKRSRIAVSWSGPYSGLLVGSVCMLAIAGTGFSDAGANEVLFKGAIWAFVYGAIINLNPLLEFDGYYILIDWLEIPMLRKRSMEFVRRNLFNKLINREPFSREERIFGVFGVMALIYTVAVIGLVLFMWQSRVSGVLEYAGGWIFWMLAGLIALVLGIPVVLGAWFLGSRAARRTGSWLNRRFLMGRPANQVATLAIAATALAVPALLIETSAGEIYTAVVGGIVVAAGLLLCVRVAFSLHRVRTAVVLLDGAPAHGHAPRRPGAQTFRRRPLSDSERHRPWGRSGRPGHRDRVARAYNRLFHEDDSPGRMGHDSVRCSPTHSRVTGGPSHLRHLHGVDLLAYGILSMGMLRLYQRLRVLRPEVPGDFASGAISDAERLSTAIRFLVDGALEQFTQVYGRRAMRAVEEQFNAAASVGTGWGISLKNGRVTESGQGSVLERSQVYVAALSRLFSMNSRVTGHRFLEGSCKGSTS